MSAAPRLVLITDTTLIEPAELVAQAERFCRRARAGTIAVMLRDHQLSARNRLALGQTLRDVTGRHAQALWLNDRLDLALLLAADAVHLGVASVAVADARSLLGERAFVSRACHSVHELEGWLEQEQHQRLEARPDAAVLSPIMAPRKGRPALGLKALEAARQAIERRQARMLLYALGGIDRHSAKACLEHGCDGVAAIAGAWLERDPEALLEALGENLG